MALIERDALATRTGSALTVFITMPMAISISTVVTGKMIQAVFFWPSVFSVRRPGRLYVLDIVLFVFLESCGDFLFCRLLDCDPLPQARKRVNPDA